MPEAQFTKVAQDRTRTLGSTRHEPLRKTALAGFVTGGEADLGHGEASLPLLSFSEPMHVLVSRCEYDDDHDAADERPASVVKARTTHGFNIATPSSLSSSLCVRCSPYQDMLGWNAAGAIEGFVVSHGLTIHAFRSCNIPATKRSSSGQRLATERKTLQLSVSGPGQTRPNLTSKMSSARKLQVHQNSHPCKNMSLTWKQHELEGPQMSCAAADSILQ